MLESKPLVAFLFAVFDIIRPILGHYYSMAISLFSLCALRAQFLILSFTETKDTVKRTENEIVFQAIKWI